jgi:hypothetical protein
MDLSNNMSAITHRDQALSILDSKLALLSKLYKECYLLKGRGALLVHASDVVERGLPNEHYYRTKEEILDVFDAPNSHAQLEEMIDNYDQKNEGILTLITGYSNASYFVTVKLK